MDKLSTHPTFEEVDQLYHFLLDHCYCREAHNKIIGCGDQYNRCYTIKEQVGSLINTYIVTCVVCHRQATIGAWDSI